MITNFIGRLVCSAFCVGSLEFVFPKLENPRAVIFDVFYKYLSNTDYWRSHLARQNTEHRTQNSLSNKSYDSVGERKVKEEGQDRLFYSKLRKQSAKDMEK